MTFSVIAAKLLTPRPLCYFILIAASSPDRTERSKVRVRSSRFYDSWSRELLCKWTNADLQCRCGWEELNNVRVASYT